jgi:hypothetical protein
MGKNPFIHPRDNNQIPTGLKGSLVYLQGGVDKDPPFFYH